MSYVALDPDQAREVASAMKRIADEVDGVRGEVGRLCAGVGVSCYNFDQSASSWMDISESITDVLNTKSDQLESIVWPAFGSSGDLPWNSSEGQGVSDAELIDELNGVVADSPSIDWQRPNDEKPGDPEWDSDPERIGDWDAATGSVQWRGRSTITRLLELMYDPTKTAPDEFVMVKLDNGKYMIGLPGVTDLSNPDFPRSLWGATPTNTLRNTFGAARPSHLSTDINDNAYALLVRKFIELHVPQGADVVLVGHSFGADSGLDIANDPETRNLVNIEAVVVAGYDSNEQLNDFDADIPVLAYQNVNDLVVMGENALYHPSQIVHSAGGFWGNVVTGDGPGAVSDGWDGITDAWNAAWAASVSRGNPQLTPGTESYGPDQHNVVFVGGLEGYGHDPNNYNNFIDATHNPAVLGFMDTLGDAGYDGEGDAYVLDVSDPG